ncbi:MAG: S41 family peptidase, partial [Planctomycetota bacterium]|nr:S41 family peptidase [Planctomycetota bacterium]
MNRENSRRDHSADHYYRPDPEAKTAEQTNGAFPMLRGFFFVCAAMAILSITFTAAISLTAKQGQAIEEADFPLLFRAIDRRLKESYIDLGRVDPQPLLRKAFTAIEFAADEIYIEDSDPANPYIPVHIGDKTSVFTLKDGMTRDDGVELIEKVFTFLSAYYSGKDSLNDIRYAAANGYLSGIDPHTLVFTPRRFEDFEVQIKGEIFGVGMLVGTNDTGRLQVKQVLKGTPAQKAGFKKDDILSKINEESTVNMTVQEAVEKIRGKRNTEITLTVKRKGGKDNKEILTVPIKVKRDRVEIKSVESKLIKGWNDESAGPWSGGVGYVHATNFDRNTYKSLRRNLNQLREANDGKPLAGLILDLRNNSGGLLSQAISMADTFLKKGEIVGTAYKRQEPDYRNAKASGTETRYPLILLADEASASAAEIVIGALQKNNRAIVIGTRTFGKGSVQQLQALPNGAQLKITVSEYLLPGKISIQETGVVPDVLAQPATLRKDLLDLFPNDSIVTERDYDAHLVSKYKIEEEPSFSLKYLARDPEEDENATVKERFISGELHPERDPLVKMALKILESSNKPFDPAAVLKEKKASFENLATVFYGEIVEKLSLLDIDWSVPPPGNPAPDKKSLGLEISHEFTSEESSDKEDPVAVNMLVVTATATNRGKSPVYRLKGVSRSDSGMLREKEFLFGKIEPGMKVSRQVKIRLPYFPRRQDSLISLDLSTSEDKVLATSSDRIIIKGREKPSFSFTASLEDSSGKSRKRLEESTDARLRLNISNKGEGRVHKGIAILRNKSGARIFLKKGRVEFLELDPGKSTEVLFEFDTKPAEDAKNKGKDYTFELTVFDSYSSEAIRKTVTISEPGEGGKDFPNGLLVAAPEIELAVIDDKSKKSSLVTSGREAELHATVRSSSDEFSAWATNLSLADRSQSPDKIFFDRSRGKKELAFKIRIQLREGLNFIRVYAKSSDGIESSRSVLVRRKN